MVEGALLAPLTAVFAAYLIHRLRFPAERLGLVDEPGGRKVHVGQIPLVGGVAIFAAFALTALLLSSDLQPYRPLFAGMGLLLITGVLDDLHDLHALEKLLLQVLAGVVLVVWGGLTVAHLGRIPPLGLFELGWLAAPFTIVCVVALINAVNMIDGIDGLCGGVVFAALGWIVVVAAVAGGSGSALALPILLAAAVLGFLAFNLPHRWRGHAAAFMGDSGSTMLGFALAWFAIECAFRTEGAVPPVVVAWILALPISDTIALTSRRLLKGQSPMVCDREHLHHLLERAGFGKCSACYLLVGASALFGGIGVGGWLLGVPVWVLWVGLVLLIAGHFVLVHHAWRALRWLRRARWAEREV